MRKYIKKLTSQGVKKIISVILSIFLALTFCGCSFVGKHIVSCIGEMFEEAPGFTYGDFGCCYVRDAKSNRATSKDNAVGVNITALVGEAREKETIIIPESIDGLPVIAVGQEGLGWMRYLKGKYRKIYLPNSVIEIKNVSYNLHFECKVFFVDKYDSVDWDKRIILLQDIIYETSIIFVAESLYEEYQNLPDIKYREHIYIANLSYVVDNEVYWIDDYEDGQYVQAPSVPSKEGFVFDGWYLDEEFSNEWDFALNQYKKPEDSASLKLYAKFVAED